MKKLCVCFPLMLAPFLILHGQTPVEQRSTLGNGGSSKFITLNGKSVIVQESIGQSSSIGIRSSRGYLLRQGFIQPLQGTNLNAISSTLQASIYPNPFSDQITVSFREEITDDIQVTIFDLLGKILYINKYNSNQEINITPNHMNPGVFILKINSGTKQLMVKIIKK